MLAAALSVLLVAWLIQLVLAIRVVAAVPAIASLPAPSRTEWPRLSILVPARDEAAGIEAALRSKLACGYPHLEVVAVDDRSRDDTGQIIDAIAAADPRVRAVHVDALPDGWLGKLNALSRARDVANGEWLLLSDADVHLAPGVLERLVAHAEAERLDLVAVFPRMHAVDPMVDALVVGTLRALCVIGRAWRANDDRTRVGVGVGAFNLVRASALAQTQGLERLRMEIADDVALGALLKQRGFRCRLFAGRDDVHLTFLDSMGAALRSAAKGAHMMGWSWWRPLATAIVPSALELGLPIAGLINGGLPAALATAALALSLLVHALIAHHFAAPARGAWLWPLGHVMSAYIMLRAGWGAWREQGVWWRGTFYPRAVVDAGRRLSLSTGRILDDEGPRPNPL